PHVCELVVRWWRGRDLNPRPSGYERDPVGRRRPTLGAGLPLITSANAEACRSGAMFVRGGTSGRSWRSVGAPPLCGTTLDGLRQDCDWSPKPTLVTCPYGGASCCSTLNSTAASSAPTPPSPSPPPPRRRAESRWVPTSSSPSPAHASFVDVTASRSSK